MKHFLTILAVFAIIACTPVETSRVPSVPGASSNDDPSQAPSSSEDPSVEPSEDVTTQPDGEISGWNCKTYSFGELIYDQDIQFIFDGKGRICEYDEHLLSYKDKGQTVWSDDHYKRIYHYTSDTHIDFYNEVMEGSEPATWYEFDSEGRIIESYKYDADNYIYSYDDDGHLVSILNSYQYTTEEDYEKYATWTKSRKIEWYVWDPHRTYQECVSPSGSEVVERDVRYFDFDVYIDNPFKHKVIDPTARPSELFSYMGWTGTKSTYLLTGWRSAEDRSKRTTVEFTLDDERHILGMVVCDYSPTLTAKREYTFTYFTEPTILPEPKDIIIN